jgi:site-specific DNA-methyltransferase (adenine-specific)
MTLTEEEVPLDSLQPYERNARTHDARNLAAIRASLTAFGQVERLTVWGTTGQVLGGNGRLQVLREMGAKTALITRVHDLSAPQAEALNVALNRSGELAGWNEAQLAAQIEAVVAAGELPLEALGFTSAELTALTDAPPVWVEPASRIAEAEDLQRTWAVELGQRWVIPSAKPNVPPHVLMVGDATDPEVVKRAVAGARCGVIVTDPPYGVGLVDKGAILRRKGFGIGGKKRFNLYSKRWAGRTIQGDEHPDAPDVLAMWRAAFEAAAEHALTPDAAWYVWYPNSRARDILNLLADLGIVLSQHLIWVKAILVLGRQDYHYRHETCFYGWRRVKGGRPPWVAGRNRDTILEGFGGGPSKGGAHPAEKPVGVLLPGVQNHLGTGGAVFDPFVGSGSTLLAAEASGRTGIGIDIDPLWAAVALQRLKDAGLKPEVQKA